MIYNIFLSQVGMTPDRVALCTSRHKYYTYSQLLDAIHQWAHYLSALGVKSGGRIGILSSDDDWHVFAYLALDCLGACYVPLDPSMPIPQLVSGLSILSLEKLLSFEITETLLDSLQSFPQLSCIELEIQKIEQYGVDRPNTAMPNDEETLAYIMSSSGSTGEPKWIPIRGKGLVYWASVEKSLFFSGNVLSTRSPAFDARISEYLRAWAQGGSLFLMTSTQRKDIHHIFRTCIDHAINTLLMVPSQLDRALLKEQLPLLARHGLKNLISTGEACDFELAQICKYANVLLWNAYGPTEATFGISLIEVTAFLALEGAIQKPVPIGKPIAPIEINIENGQLVIYSPFLAPYYITQAGEIPIGSHFNTEDCFEEVNGVLYYWGRVKLTSHVKIMGVKVSPSEVESVLNKFLGIQAAVVAKKWSGHAKLFAYIQKNSTYEPETFFNYLKNNLSQAQMPICFSIDLLPRLRLSDKVDRKKLLEKEDDPEDRILFFRNALSELSEEQGLLKRMCILWETLFEVSIQPDDHFEVLGGDSILATKLTSLIRRDFKSDYTYGHLWSLSQITPRALVKQLTLPCEKTKPLASVHALAQIGAESNLFMLPPLLGDGYFTYQKIASLYASKLGMNIFSLSSPALSEETYLPVSLEEEVLNFVEAIKRVQPQGPFHLSGFSYGAFLAYEVARRLLEENHSVSYLDLIDGFPPEPLQCMSVKNHSQLLQALLTFVIQVLNKKPYEENIPLFSLDDLEGMLTKACSRKLYATHLILKQNGLQNKLNQVTELFFQIRQMVSKDFSRNIINLIEQHLIFMLTYPTPSAKLPIVPKIYQSRTDQAYWETLLNSGGPKVHGDPNVRYLFWNQYFLEARRNGNTPKEDSHLDLIKKEEPLANYHERIQFKAFNQLKGYGPDPLYLCNLRSGDFHYHLCFISMSQASDILETLENMGILFFQQSYHASQSLIDQNDAMFCSLCSIYFSVREEEKKKAVDIWLSKRIGLKGKSLPNIGGYKSLELSFQPKKIHLKITCTENESLTPYTDLSNLLFFKIPFNKKLIESFSYTREEYLEKITLLDFSFELKTPLNAGFLLKYPDCFRLAYHETYPEVVYFEWVIVQNEWNASTLIDLSAPIIGELIGQIQKAYQTPFQYMPPHYEAFIEVPKWRQIPFFPEIPNKDSTLHYLSLTEFYDRFHTQYGEGLFWEPQSNKKISNLGKLQENVISGISAKKLSDQLAKILEGTSPDYLAITCLDGVSSDYAVCACQNIPKHTVVCIYSGEIIEGRKVQNPNNRDYPFFEANFHVDATHIGGIARFMTHLPGNSEVFGGEKDRFATTNVIPEFIVYEGKPFIVMVSLREIDAYELVGFSWGHEFWSKRGSPPLFDKEKRSRISNSSYSYEQLKLSCGFKL